MDLSITILYLIAAMAHVSAAQPCTKEMKECKTFRLCLNGGTCKLIYSDNCTVGCECSTRYRGMQCEYVECSKGLKCFQGHCISFGFPPFCSCMSGWHGKHCNETYKVCEQGLRCHGGSCRNIGPVEMCACKGGYIGKNCDIECSCENGGTCTILLNTNKCICREGYYGKYCELKGKKTCHGGLDCYKGMCVDSGTESFKNCLCEHGWTGLYCNRTCSLCCQNGGSCSFYTGSQKDKCVCPAGYRGSLCQRAIATTTTTTIKTTICKESRASGSILSLLLSLVPVCLSLVPVCLSLEPLLVLFF